MSHTILLVEDDLDTQANLRDILELDGYAVEVAASANEALAQTDFTRFTAILLDRKLPDGNAEELLPQIRQRATEASVIVVTGHADLDGTIAALRHGAEDYILKPINPDALRASLARIEKLRDAETRAQQAERLAVIGRMITVLSHESRNALQRISACSEMLGMELERLSDNEGALKDLAKIQTATDDLKTLLEEVRNYAAPIKLDRSQCCVAEICKRAWNALSSTRAGREAELIEPAGHAVTHCSCDEFRLEQVFRNLFENALSATDDPVQIEVTCSEGSIGDTAALSITVSDNGPGLSSESRQKVFDAFYTTKSKGTGLGMAIVRRVVQAHGGTVHVDPSDKGARFTVKLPQNLETTCEST